MTTLFFLHETGCPACEEAKPVVGAFAMSHSDVEVVMLDLTVEDWPEDADVDPPEAIPSYAIMVDGHVQRTLVGRVLKQEELEKWVRGW